MFRSLKEAGDLNRNLQGILMGGWEPKTANGLNRPGWTSRDDHRKDALTNGPEVCWDSNGDVTPLGLFEMTDEEREVSDRACVLTWKTTKPHVQAFSSSVNSPLKPPVQSSSKDPNALNNGVGARKSSLSQGQSNSPSYALSSPTSTRPPTRRRETSDSIPHAPSLGSPNSSSKSVRDDPQSPPPNLTRRATDFRDGQSTSGEREREQEGFGRDSPAETPTFPSFLRRSTTGPLSASGTGPASPWGRESGSFSPMGSFGNFGLTDAPGQAAPTAEKKSSSGSLRGGSRWSKFMGKEGSEDGASRLTDRPSAASLSKVSEVDAETSSQSWRDVRPSRPLSHDTDPFGDDGLPSGSAALGGGQDISPPQHRGAPGLRTPNRATSREGFDLADVGMSSGLPDRPQQVAQQVGSHRPSHSLASGQEPLSPTETNPYQSPLTEKADSDDIDTDDSELHNLHHPGLSGMSGEPTSAGFGNVSRGVSNPYDGLGGDRSQTSSAGPSRPFPTLGGLGSAGAWPGNAATLNTPDRERAGFPGPFGNPVFGPMADLQSPSLVSPGAGQFGGNHGVGPSGAGAAGRGSKLGSLFPAAMQAQMHGANASKAREDESSFGGGAGPGASGGSMGQAPFNPSGLGFPGSGRDVDTPMRGGKGIFDDMLFSGMEGARPGLPENSSAPIDSARKAGAQQSSGSGPPPTSATSGQVHAQPDQPQSQGAQASQPPQSQQRTMVMPDRMRWIYRDPQGSTQGPWSGLEMHDWFKAGFFSAELLVKKFEDPEYEPLGQMIRRIGNSREPFLVPQIGIPHGPASAAPNAQWSTPGTTPGGNPPPAQGGSVQPPFAGAFPSFGTTLTAEQQNALERRKQEEQFLMARQKEYLAQQQVIQKQMHQIPGAPHGVNPQPLHHHSSAHSLHSQPSFGSITSPGQFHATPPQGPLQASQGVPGFFDAQMRLASASGSGPTSDFPSSGGSRDEELAALLARQSLGRDGQHGAGMAQQYQQDGHHPQQIAAMLAQRSQLEREQAQYDAMQTSNSTEQEPNTRLDQFNEVRAQHEYSQSNQPAEGVIGKPMGHSTALAQASADSKQQQQQQYRNPLQMDDLIARAQKAGPSNDGNTAESGQEVLSLAQQVQKAASAKQSPALSSQPESAWGKTAEKARLPQPFPPPPQSTSPLPAPAAQRSRQNLPEALNAESRSLQPTPTSETPVTAASIAPWAKDANDGSRGPSLKEIQELEARKAARAEEAALAARRATVEQERLQQASAPAPAPGLPTSSTWGSSGSPGIPTGSNASAWAKPLAGKAKPAQGGVGMKKSLSRIQREEEARKQKITTANGVGAAAASPTAPQTGASAGKRYADLASKAAVVAQPPNPSGPWMTVGASGKAKVPASPATSGAPATVRGASSGAVPSSGAGKSRPPGPPTRSATMGGPLQGQQNANDEFTRWAKGALAKGLNSNINGR